MDQSLAAALLMVGAVVVVLASGLWISIGLAGIGILSFYLFLPPSMMRMVEVIQYNTLNDFIIAAIPLFIFMGSLLYKGDIASKIYRGLGKSVSRLPGGLVQTNIVACAIFGACSGSSLAGAATMGTMAVRELKSQGYEKTLVYGSLAAGGTLATMIPPSILFIVYGAFAGESVSKLFIAGIVPGIILVLLFMGYILVKTLMQPEVCPRFEPAPLGEALQALTALILPFLLIAAVLGSIYTGFATPTESAAVGSVGALAILAVDGNLRWSVVREAAVLSVRTTCMIALMMVGTQIISTSLSVLQIPAQISAYFAALAVEPWVIAVLVGLFYIVLGCLIEGTSMFFLTFPVIYPLMMSIGFDPIWFGVMMALFIEASLITPPVGLNLFIIQQVSDEPSLGPVIKGSLPFCVVIMAVMGLFIAFPELVLYLPSKL